MDRHMRQSLDRYITGNYGEDQFREQDDSEAERRIVMMYGRRAVVLLDEPEPIYRHGSLDPVAGMQQRVQYVTEPRTILTVPVSALYPPREPEDLQSWR